MRIEFQKIRKDFGDGREIVRSVDYSGDFETLAIIGPSGAGKSTLLRIIGGLITPSSGRMLFDGRELDFTEPALEAHRKSLGFVFQQGGLFSHMPALRNIALPLEAVHGVSKADAEARAMELLRRFNLADSSHKLPAALSGGQQQRVAIARAIAARPKLLLLDEPTSALDPEYTTEVLDIINELRGEGINFIIVTHEMGFARHACEKIMFIHDGALLEHGRSQDLFTDPQTPELQRFLSKLLEWDV